MPVHHLRLFTRHALVVIGILALAFFGGEPLPSERSSTIGHSIDAVLGVLFLVFALKRCLYVPDPDAPPPRLLSSLERIAPGKSFVLGTLMTVTNFTSLALYVSGLKDIVVAKVGALGSVTAFTLLIVREVCRVFYITRSSSAAGLWRLI